MNIDVRNKLVFACHPGKKSIAVLNLADNTATDVPVGFEVNGASADSRGKVIYAAGPGNTLVKLDETTWKVVGTLALGGPGDCVQYHRKEKSIYVDNDDGTNVWIVDEETLKLKATIKINEAPEYMEVDTDNNKIYQAIKSTSTVQVLDIAGAKAVAEYKLGELTGPHGLALDRKTRRVYVAGKNGKLVTLDADSGKILATTDVVTGSDQIAYDSANMRLYIPSQGVIQVLQIKGDEIKEIGRVPVGKDCHRVAIDRGTHTVYVAYTDGKESYFQAFTAN